MIIGYPPVNSHRPGYFCLFDLEVSEKKHGATHWVSHIKKKNHPLEWDFPLQSNNFRVPPF